MTVPPAGTGCECPEAATLSRRTFLRGAAVGAAALATPLVSSRLAFASGPTPPGTLVVLSLRGGFDGLSAFAPVGDRDYLAARPAIALPAARAIPLDRTFGMHPALSPLKPLWDSGAMAVVHDVGTPDATRSHFTAQDELERAAPGSALRTGWLDRVLDLSGVPTVFTATQVGTDGRLPRSLVGPNDKMGLSRVDDVELAGVDVVGARLRAAVAGLHEGAPGPLARGAAGALRAVDTAAGLAAVPSALPPGVTYPPGDFGRTLREVARLIKSGVGLKIATLDLGNWDMHAGVGEVDDGWMQRKLRELGLALAAFAADLGSLMATTTLVTLSEFGRRVAQNSSNGVDHGHGNAVLLLGGGIVGGRVHGRWPGLSPAGLDRGDLPGSNDYRDVLGELLARRLGVTDLSTVFPGHRPTFLGVARRT